MLNYELMVEQCDKLVKKPKKSWYLYYGDNMDTCVCFPWLLLKKQKLISRWRKRKSQKSLNTVFKNFTILDSQLFYWIYHIKNCIHTMGRHSSYFSYVMWDTFLANILMFIVCEVDEPAFAKPDQFIFIVGFQFLSFIVWIHRKSFHSHSSKPADSHHIEL